jgi:signal transduction histidine kinase
MNKKLIGIILFLAIISSVSVGLINLYSSSSQRLDKALGDRLTGVAVTASYLVDGDSLSVWSYDPIETIEFDWLRSRLEQIRIENELAEITLCDIDGFVLISVANRMKRGNINSFWKLDNASVMQAQSGMPAASKLYVNGNLYQKSAHAPVRNFDGKIVGILSVEGNADFFDSLASLRRAASITGASVLLFLVLMGLLLVKLQNSIMQWKTAVAQQQNLATMGRMTAGIAHEIRNPLGIIRATAEHLADKLNERGVEDCTTNFIPEEVDRLDRILTRYLAFGKGDKPDYESIDVQKLIARSIEMFQTESDIEIEYITTGAKCSLNGDSPGLQQVLLNLLINARDVADQVIVELNYFENHVEISVKDNGPGIGRLSDKDLFEPFTTTKEKGSGLGLALVRRIIEEHGGTVTLVNQNIGAIAKVILPLTRD